MRSYVPELDRIRFKNLAGTQEPRLDGRTILITQDGARAILEKARRPVNNNTTDAVDTDVLVADARPVHVEPTTLGHSLTIYSYFNNHMCFEYHVGFEVAALLDYKNPARAVKDLTSKCNQLLFGDYPGVKRPLLHSQTVLLTRDGVCEMLHRTRKLISPDVQYLFREFNFEVKHKKYLSKEQTTLSRIVNAFKIENAIPQYPVGKYFLDLYFPDYKIVAECDEFGHVDRDPDKEREREEFVNKELGIDMDSWIRFNPDEADFDISKVIGQIYLKISTFREATLSYKRCCTCR